MPDVNLAGNGLPRVTLRGVMTLYSFVALCVTVGELGMGAGWFWMGVFLMPVYLFVLLLIVEWPIFWMLRRAGLLQDVSDPDAEERNTRTEIDPRDRFPGYPRNH
ncbi:MAG: hypothetical protein QM811_30490 [Pirellulales bacterium]